jgi:hypothetical protein
VGGALRKIVAWCTALVLAGTLTACRPLHVVAGAVSVSWGQVIQVPGLAALNTGKGGQPTVSVVSCASPGNCAAGGGYWHRGQQGFAALERNGRWGKASGIPGLAALNVNLNGNGDAGVVSMSCLSGDYCVAGGYYAEDVHLDDGFVVAEKNGVWGKVATLPINAYYGGVDSVSCTSAGNCVASGWAADDYTSGTWYEFVAEERNGRWGKDIGLPGLATLDNGGDSETNSVWCVSAGNCAAGGYYTDKSGNDYQGFLAVERDGRWGTAIGVPGLPTLNTRGNAEVSSVSCASAGNCVAGGYYKGSHGLQAFTIVEQNGHWITATPVPGLAALTKGGPTTVNSVSCAPQGSCEVAGSYTDGSGHHQGFVAAESNGHWGTPIPLPGLAALSKGGSAEVSSLSCPSSGWCGAAGNYTNQAGARRQFVTQGK